MALLKNYLKKKDEIIVDPDVLYGLMKRCEKNGRKVSSKGKNKGFVESTGLTVSNVDPLDIICQRETIRDYINGNINTAELREVI